MKNFLLPEGAINLENIDEIRLHRMLEETGAGDLIPVLKTFAEGQILEEQGKFRDAQRLYNTVLKRHPDNEWLKTAAQRVRYILN